MERSTLLDRMKLEHQAAQLDGICEHAAHSDIDFKGFLAQALEAKWRGRYQKSVESRLKQARFPWVKTLEQFDYDFQPSVDRKAMRELAGLSFVERAQNVVLLGPPGVGKTHLAIGVGVKAVEAGYSVLFLTFDTLMTRLVRARHENRLDRTVQQLDVATSTERISLSRSKGTRRPVFLMTVSSRNCTRSNVVKRPPQSGQTRRRRMDAASSVGRESFTCVSRLPQYGHRIGVLYEI